MDWPGWIRKEEMKRRDISYFNEGMNTMYGCMVFS